MFVEKRKNLIEARKATEDNLKEIIAWVGNGKVQSYKPIQCDVGDYVVKYSDCFVIMEARVFHDLFVAEEAFD